MVTWLKLQIKEYSLVYSKTFRIALSEDILRDLAILFNLSLITYVYTTKFTHKNQTSFLSVENFSLITDFFLDDYRVILGNSLP